MDAKKDNESLDVLTLYSNYLHAIETYEECGETYGDTLVMFEMYESKLKKYNIKPINKKIFKV